jgi:FMN-dependent NADH-azoreductase
VADPATDNAAREKLVADLLAELGELGDEEVLDGLVLGTAEVAAACLNQEGWEAQVNYLTAELGDAGVAEIRRVIAEAKQKEASDG